MLHTDVQVVQFWDEGLEGCVEELGEERWMVLEQVGALVYSWLGCH